MGTGCSVRARSAVQSSVAPSLRSLSAVEVASYHPSGALCQARGGGALRGLGLCARLQPVPAALPPLPVPVQRDHLQRLGVRRPPSPAPPAPPPPHRRPAPHTAHRTPHTAHRTPHTAAPRSPPQPPAARPCRARVRARSAAAHYGPLTTGSVLLTPYCVLVTRYELGRPPPLPVSFKGEALSMMRRPSGDVIDEVSRTHRTHRT